MRVKHINESLQEQESGWYHGTYASSLSGTELFLFHRKFSKLPMRQKFWETLFVLFMKEGDKKNEHGRN